MRRAPLVSVIIPTRDRLGFLKQAVGSVMAQTLSSYEVVVVDDASSDGTAEWVAAKDDERLTAITLEQHSERAVARNRGLAQARGEFVLFLDDDDRLRPSAVRKLYFALHQDPKSIGALGALELFDGHGNHRRLRHPKRKIKRTVWSDLLTYWMPPLGTALFRTDVLRAAGAWDEGITVSGDRELFVRVARRGPVILVPDVVLDKRTHAGQWRATEIREIQERWVQEHLRTLPRDERALAIRLNMAYRLLNDARIAHGDFENRKALSRYGQALRSAPSLVRSPLIRPDITRGTAKSLVGLIVGRRGMRVARSAKQKLRRWIGKDVEEIKGRRSVEDHTPR